MSTQNIKKSGNRGIEAMAGWYRERGVLTVRPLHSQHLQPVHHPPITPDPENTHPLVASEGSCTHKHRNKNKYLESIKKYCYYSSSIFLTVKIKSS